MARVQAITEQTVFELVQDQRDKYAGQEEGLRNRGHETMADYLKEAQFRLAGILRQISDAQGTGDPGEAHKRSLAVADDTVEFMASQMRL